MATIAPAADDVAYLDELGDEEFKQTVMANLDQARGDRRIWAALCHAANNDRAVGCLEEILEELQADVATRRLPATHHKTKLANVVRLRLSQVQAATAREERRGQRRVAHDERILTEHEAVRLLLRRLTLAVNDHRLACIDADLTPEEHDLALWQALEELVMPNTDPTSPARCSLADLIVQGVWHHVEVA